MSEKAKRKNDEVVSNSASGIKYCLVVLLVSCGFFLIAVLLYLGIISLIAPHAASYWTQLPVYLVYFWAPVFISLSGAIVYMIFRGLRYINRKDSETHI